MSALDLLGFGPDGWGPMLLRGVATTIALSVTSMAIGTLLGGLLAWGRLRGPGPVRVASAAYGVVLRGVPELLVILLLYFGLPTLIGWIAQALGFAAPPTAPAFLLGALSIGLVSAAYQAEVFRGGVAAVPRGQMEAARAFGLGEGMAFRRVLAPQLLRVTLPALGNVWQFNLKDSALVSVTGLSELMRTSLVGAGSTRQPFLFFAAAIVLYLALTSVSDAGFRALNRRVDRGTA
ncbi:MULTISPECIES: ABC transporter permease [Alphaproteobacteria]|uniref:ABC transporter permease n=1 Tax=Alphaproteobacteria TaxID=28211 RepID=UPI000DB222DD|nr:MULTISPECIES: ABC transporter permease subunit [Alphaproteobacteria]PZP65985.1 MAG: ABC transporter permease [Methylorubrum populi]